MYQLSTVLFKEKTSSLRKERLRSTVPYRTYGKIYLYVFLWKGVGTIPGSGQGLLLGSVPVLSLVVLGRPYMMPRIEPGLVICKASTLISVLLLWPNRKIRLETLNVLLSKVLQITMLI